VPTRAGSARRGLRGRLAGPGPRMGAAQLGDFVPHKQLGILEGSDRPSRTSQPQSRTKMR